MAGYDPDDPYSRPAAVATARRTAAAAPDRRAARRASACSTATATPRPTTPPRSTASHGLGATMVEIDIEPFYETARLLYEGPWLAERYVVTRNFIASSPQTMHPVTREILLGGARPTAADAFTALYQLEHLRRIVGQTVRTIRRAGAADRAHALHGRPNPRRSDPTQFAARHLHQLRQPARPVRARGAGGAARCRAGVSRSASRCWRPAAMTASSPRSAAVSTPIPRCRSARSAASSRRSPPSRMRQATRSRSRSSARISPACRSITNFAAMPPSSSRRPRPRRTIGSYALPGTAPPKPGLCASPQARAAPSRWRSGRWRAEPFGRFTAAVPPPLSIGSIRLADGRWVKGFLVEAEAVNGARDISSFGGWRDFVAKAAAG